MNGQGGLENLQDELGDLVRARDRSGLLLALANRLLEATSRGLIARVHFDTAAGANIFLPLSPLTRLRPPGYGRGKPWSSPR